MVSSSLAATVASAQVRESGEEQLLIPVYDVVDPEFSIVIPSLNEELTIGQFVEWCREGLQTAGVRGEILIVDSSSDRTAEIALSKGARVLKTPRRGLGRAYMDAIPFIRGKYAILGDADLTYDFRNLKPFVQKFRAGYEYIMGSRFEGYIEKDAMPPLHRYFGTPLTTWMLNVLYGSNFSDIHCGMRGVTTEALRRMELRSQSWQYASEMIIKSIHLGLPTDEVPVTFYKDIEGRQSHFKRTGWWAPWGAGWLTLQAMFTWGADFFLIRPGLLLFFLGCIGVATLFHGPIELWGIGFSLHWMLFFLLLLLVGVQLFMMGMLARALYGYRNRKRPWQRVFGFTPAVIISSVLFVAGILSLWPIAQEYVVHQYRLPALMTASSFEAVGGMGLVLWSFIHFTFSMVYNAVLLSAKLTGAPTTLGS